MKWITLSGLASIGAKPSIENIKDGIVLCPAPKKIEYLGNVYQVTGDCHVSLSDVGDDSYLVEQINEELEQHGIPTLKVSSLDEKDLEILNGIVANASVADPEGFHTETKNGMLVIVGKTTAGLFYGIQTFYQLIVQRDDRLLLPAVKIDDYPTMKIRGLSWDISRGQSPSIEAVKRHVKLLSRFRLNLFQFYIEDMFQIEKYPQIGKGRGALSPGFVKEIEEFASKYNVEIMPIFQNLSHMENILLDPELKKYGEYPGAGSLNLGHPNIKEFVSNLLSSVAPAFRSTKFHIGCDESWDVGVYAGKKYIEEKGMARALLDHYLFVIEELKKHGKDTFFLYHDIACKYDEVLQGLPKNDVVMVFWEYSIRNDWPTIDRIAGFSIPFVVSSSTLAWVKPFPDLARSFEANRKLIDNGLKKGAIGQINSTWGDNGQENFHENNLIPFCYSSAYSWNPEGFTNEKFLQAFSKATFGIHNEDLNQLYTALFSIYKEFPAKYMSKWLGFLWRHPYHSKTLDNSHYDDEARMEISPDLVYHESDMEEQRPLCQRIITLSRKLKTKVKKNEMMLEYWEYAGMLLEYFINKIQTTAKVTNMCRSGLNDDNATKITEMIATVIEQAKNLKNKFEKLWLYCASRPMLDRIIRFWDWQIYWQQQKIEQIKTGIAWEEPYIESEWIMLDEKEKTQEPRYFRKTFEIPDDKIAMIERAHLQIVPGNHAEVWINKKKLGEAQCSYQASAPVIDNNVTFWDVKDMLKPGKNVIGIKATCYFTGNPVINVYSEIKFSDGTLMKVLSDTTWKTSTTVPDDWLNQDFDDSKWHEPISKGKPPKYMGEIVKPRFDVGWKSKHTHQGFCRILREKASADNVGEFFDDFYFYNGNIL
ncbi:MAG: glycoside hydrolase family 20 zincin-like fold domain-containing protein [Promethearchaeota archaeon]